MTDDIDGPPLADGGDQPGLVASPALAELLANLEVADRANARATALLTELHASGEVEEATGVAVEAWLLSVGATRSDRRMLSTAAVQLARLPAVRSGFDRGLLSWGQVRAICLVAERLSAEHASALDLTLAPAIERYAGADPDALVAIARQAVDHLLSTSADAPEPVEPTPFLHFQPRLDGSGAKVYGDLDGLGYGLVTGALDAGAPLPPRRRELVGQRPAATADAGRGLGRWRADRLVQLCADELGRRGQPVAAGAPLAADAGAPPAADAGAPSAPDTGGPLAADAGAVPVDRTRALAPEALLVLTVDQLLGRDDVPIELVTTVTGGRLKVAAPTARRWLDDAGGRLRTIVLDETGQVLGVGRRTRVPKRWMRDVALATDATCQAPGCATAAAGCDLDHHLPVHPVRPDDPPGRTDVANLGPVCRSDNVDKERQGWQVRRMADGTIDWHHPRSGMRVRTVPWSVRRAAARPPDRRAGTGPPRPPGPPDTAGPPGPRRPRSRDPDRARPAGPPARPRPPTDPDHTS